MAVYIFSTGSIPTASLITAGTTVTISVDNRTSSVQTLRADLWDTSNGKSPKVLLASQPIATIGPNGGVSFNLTTTTAQVPGAGGSTAFEVEIRLSSAHMAANVITATGVIFNALATKLPILPNEFFRDNDPNGSV